MKTVVWVLIALLAIGAGAWLVMFRMPGQNFSGTPPPLAPPQAAVRDALRRDVQKLAGEIGERNLPRYEALTAAAQFLESSLAAAGFPVERQGFEVWTPAGMRRTHNLIAELGGSAHPEEVVIIGAHYDSVEGTPGADDNASGAAAVLALARGFAGGKPARTLRFLLFANEEPPYFRGDSMGSLVYAKRCRARGDNVVAMLSLETIGYFSDQPASQQYPFPINLLYPSTGDFLGFVGNVGSRGLVRRAVAAFRGAARIPSEGLAAPSLITGIDWSDHWSFWRQGYPGIMVTDTALFRNPHYHRPTDTPEKLDYDRLALVVEGLQAVVCDLTGLAKGP
jgi:hypothetical protein